MNAAKVWNIFWGVCTVVSAIGGVAAEAGIYTVVPHTWLHALSAVFAFALVVHNHKNLGDIIGALVQANTPAPTPPPQPSHLPGEKPGS